MKRNMLFGLVALLASQAHAQILFSDDFDDGAAATRWSAPLVTTENGVPDSNVDYAFDYSQILNPFAGNTPIPSAPNSAGTTTGIYMTANNTDECPGAAQCPDSSDEGDAVGIASNYQLPTAMNYKVTADLFLFWNGGGGSTEYAILGVNHDGSDNIPFRFGINAGVGRAWVWDTDGDSGTDILTYDGTSETGLGGWEDIPNGTIPGVPTGAPAPVGPFSQWVEMELTVANGTSRLSMNGALIDVRDNPNVGDSILLGHADYFNSVNNAIQGFTNGSIWDNVVVMKIPEPSTVLLAGLGLVALAARRRG